MALKLFWLALLSANAFASPKKIVPARASEQVITVAVPKSEIALEPLVTEKPRPVEFELSVASFVPDNFARDTYSKGTSSFEKGTLPFLSLNRIGEFAHYENGIHISSKLGLSYLSLQRSDNLQFGGLSGGTDVENLNLYIGRVGVEAAWADLLPWELEPNLSFSFLPTWMTAERSAIEDHTSGFGIPFEATIGILWRTNIRASVDRGNLSVGIAAQTINGKVAGSSLTGTGLIGELRISI